MICDLYSFSSFNTIWRNTVLNYVNSLGVGEDVILTEIIDRIMDVSGVLDLRILTPTAKELVIL